MAWAIKQQEITEPTERLVLMCLANYAGEDGANAFPSLRQLMQDTGLSEATVRRHLQRFEQAGVIKRGNQEIAAAYIKRADRRPVVYDITPRGLTVTPRTSDGVSPEVSRGVTEAATGSQALTPNPKRSEENLRGARPTPAEPGPREDLGYTPPEGSLARALREREEPPKGRQPNADAEFKARFGMTPDEAHAMRQKAKQ